MQPRPFEILPSMQARRLISLAKRDLHRVYKTVLTYPGWVGAPTQASHRTSDIEQHPPRARHQAGQLGAAHQGRGFCGINAHTGN